MHIKVDYVRELRRKKDFSQDYLAELLELSQSQYSRIENGECTIDIEKANKIAAILETNVLDILEFSDKQSFINCSQSGNIGSINNNGEKLTHAERKAYLSQIEELKKDKEIIHQDNLSLRKMLEKFLDS